MSSISQNEKQTIVCVFGSKVLVEQMSQNEFLFDGGDVVKERFGKAAAELDECCKAIMMNLEPAQRKEVEAVIRTYKLVMMPALDPNAKVKKFMIADSDMQVILKNLFENCCHLCTKDKTAVKYCELRRALQNAGYEGVDGGLGFAPCEYA